MLSPSILALRKSKGSHPLDTKVCDKQVGCGLQHERPGGQAKAVGYYSSFLKGLYKPWHIACEVSFCRMGHCSADTVSWTVMVYYQSESDGLCWTCLWCTCIKTWGEVAFVFKARLPSYTSDQTKASIAGPIIPPPTIRMDKSSLEDTFQVLMIAEGQPDGKNIWRDQTSGIFSSVWVIWTRKNALPELFHLLDGTDKWKRRLRPRILSTLQMINCHRESATFLDSLDPSIPISEKKGQFKHLRQRAL